MRGKEEREEGRKKGKKEGRKEGKPQKFQALVVCATAYTDSMQMDGRNHEDMAKVGLLRA